MVFLEKINIAKWENLAAAATEVGLNAEQLESDFNGRAKDLFNEDLQLGLQLGVRGFPTLFFVDSEGNQEKVYGTKPYSAYEDAVLKQLPVASKKEIDADWGKLFSIYNKLTAREFSELSQTPRQQAEQLLQGLAKLGILNERVTKNGSLWRIL